ncbi:Retrotransposon gag domain [Arabidopsis thaliana x Arabidopsis arenosa]|uniref:Retrotransposon gag domain n=1 Tax=Arabidopsis thaliana x Arabidopsis arenosa TaxID=1240361 RepID=A0A8T2AYQ0_9BRAS|nr:Retrotransposon gag domain [Arabidopsis thaliana x Arabidopsis arenosa]
MAETRSQAPIKETVAREAIAVVRETVAEMWFRSRSRYADPKRLETVDFPRFHGDKIMDWLFQIEQFFLIDRTPEELKVGIASSHFDDIAATLHQSIVQSMWWKHVRHDWWSYKLLLQVRYNKHVDDSIAKLKLLQETEGIEGYHARFESISTRVKLDEDYLVSLYLTGLENDTQVNVKMFQPQTIQQCFLIGKLYERAHPKKNNVNNWSGAKWSGSNSQSKGILSSKPEPDHNTVLLTSMESPKDTTTQPHKVLSTEDMSKQRDQELCYVGDDKYKKPRFGAEEDGGELEEVHAKNVELAETGVIAHISVKAVSGVSDYRTMRVKGSYEKQVLYIFIDPDSTHNFMDPTVAEKLKCVLKPTSMARVSVADGRMLEVDAKIDRFQWEFRGTQVQADLMVIPLRGCDMVLGVQWLETLGPITCDFKKLEMQFRIGRKKVLLQGIRQGSVRDVKAFKLNMLKGEVKDCLECVSQPQNVNATFEDFDKADATMNHLLPPSGCVVDDLQSGCGSDIVRVQNFAGPVVVGDLQETPWILNVESKDIQSFQVAIDEDNDSFTCQEVDGILLRNHMLHQQKKPSKYPKSWKFKFKINSEDIKSRYTKFWCEKAIRCSKKKLKCDKSWKVHYKNRVIQGELVMVGKTEVDKESVEMFKRCNSGQIIGAYGSEIKRWDIHIRVWDPGGSIFRKFSFKLSCGSG